MASYNIHHGAGIDSKPDLEGAAGAISRTGSDITGLQEVDCYMPRSGFANQCRSLGKKLGMTCMYGPNMAFLIARYGNAVLSRLPVVDTKNIALPGGGEPRGLQLVALSGGNLRLYFMNTHLGLSESYRARQIRHITGFVKSLTGPLVMTGDFNTPAGSDELLPISRLLACATGGLRSYPAGDPAHAIDQIYISHHWDVLEVYTVASLASDHLPVAARLKLKNTY